MMGFVSKLNDTLINPNVWSPILTLPTTPGVWLFLAQLLGSQKTQSGVWEIRLRDDLNNVYAVSELAVFAFGTFPNLQFEGSASVLAVATIVTAGFITLDANPLGSPAADTFVAKANSIGGNQPGGTWLVAVQDITAFVSKIYKNAQ